MWGVDTKGGGGQHRAKKVRKTKKKDERDIEGECRSGDKQTE